MKRARTAKMIHEVIRYLWFRCETIFAFRPTQSHRRHCAWFLLFDSYFARLYTDPLWMFFSIFLASSLLFLRLFHEDKINYKQSFCPIGVGRANRQRSDDANQARRARLNVRWKPLGLPRGHGRARCAGRRGPGRAIRAIRPSHAPRIAGCLARWHCDLRSRQGPHERHRHCSRCLFSSSFSSIITLHWPSETRSGEKRATIDKSALRCAINSARSNSRSSDVEMNMKSAELVRWFLLFTKTAIFSVWLQSTTPGRCVCDWKTRDCWRSPL